MTSVRVAFVCVRILSQHLHSLMWCQLFSQKKQLIILEHVVWMTKWLNKLKWYGSARSIFYRSGVERWYICTCQDIISVRSWQHWLKYNVSPPFSVSSHILTCWQLCLTLTPEVSSLPALWVRSEGWIGITLEVRLGTVFCKCSFSCIKGSYKVAICSFLIWIHCIFCCTYSFVDTK